jgi:hypothetical protein
MTFGSPIFLAPTSTMSTMTLGPVTLTGFGATQDLNSFLSQIEPYTANSFEFSPTPVIQPVRFQAAESRIDRALGGSGLVGASLDEATQWQRPVPEHRVLIQESTVNITQAAQLVSQFTDPVLLEVHMSLNQAGYLRYDDNRNCFCMRYLTDWREGIEVTEILYAHTHGTDYDILDFIHEIDWGKIDSYGFKGINASFRSLGDYERHNNKKGTCTTALLKSGCIGHVFQGRLMGLGMALETLSYGIEAQTQPIHKKQAKLLSKIEAASSYENLARLIIEVAVCCKMASSFPNDTRTSPDYFYDSLKVLFDKKQADYLHMSREEYETMHARRFKEIWSSIDIRPRDAQNSSLDLIKNTKTYGPNGLEITDTPDPEDLISINAAEEIRVLNAKLAYIAGVMPAPLAPLLQALRLTSFILSLASALPRIENLANTTEEQHYTYCMISFERLCRRLKDLLHQVHPGIMNIDQTHYWRTSFEPSPRSITTEYLQNYFKEYPPFSAFRQYMFFVTHWAEKRLGQAQTAPYATTINSLIDLWEEKMPFTSDVA